MMNLFSRKEQKPTDQSWITANEAKKLTRAKADTGYNVAESIKEKANAGRSNLYVASWKIDDIIIQKLMQSGFKVRPVRHEKSEKVEYYSIEW